MRALITASALLLATACSGTKNVTSDELCDRVGGLKGNVVRLQLADRPDAVVAVDTTLVLATSGECVGQGWYSPAFSCPDGLVAIVAAGDHPGRPATVERPSDHPLICTGKQPDYMECFPGCRFPHLQEVVGKLRRPREDTFLTPDPRWVIEAHEVTTSD